MGPLSAPVTFVSGHRRHSADVAAPHFKVVDYLFSKGRAYQGHIVSKVKVMVDSYISVRAMTVPWTG